MYPKYVLLAAITVALILSTGSISLGQAAGQPGDDPFDPFRQSDADEVRDATRQSHNNPQQRHEHADVTLLADPPVAGQEQPPCHCADESDSRSITRIKKVLQDPLASQGLDFPGTPLKQVVSFLQEEYDIPIQLDSTALDGVGIGPDEPVTITARNITLQSALRLILEQLGLTYVIRNEVLMITTPQEAETQLRICVYNVRDLVTMPNGRQDFDSLIDTIVSCVATDTWAENGGGEAQIRSLPTGLLTISQTQSVHEEIAGLLAAIRRSLNHELTSPDAAQEFVPATKLITQSYQLALNEEADVRAAGSHVVAMIRELVPGANSKTVDGEKCWMDHFSGRIVVRHAADVHDGIRELLTDLGLLKRPSGGFGGGGIAN